MEFTRQNDRDVANAYTNDMAEQIAALRVVSYASIISSERIPRTDYHKVKYNMSSRCASAFIPTINVLILCPLVKMADILTFNLTQTTSHAPRMMNAPDLSTKLKYVSLFSPSPNPHLTSIYTD